MTEIILDCSSEICPVPLIRTKKKMETLQIGEVLVVKIDHSCAMNTVPEWAKSAGYNVDIHEIGAGQWIVCIEKTK